MSIRITEESSNNFLQELKICKTTKYVAVGSKGIIFTLAEETLLVLFHTDEQIKRFTEMLINVINGKTPKNDFNKQNESDHNYSHPGNPINFNYYVSNCLENNVTLYDFSK